MLEKTAPQLPSSPTPDFRGSPAATLTKFRRVRSEKTGNPQSAILENVPEAAGCLMGLIEETNNLMSEVQTVLRRIGVELERLGISTSILPDSCLPPAHTDLDALSPRESEIAELLMYGNRVSSIARSLFISEHTVRNHLQSVYRKLGVSSQVELIEKLKASVMPSPAPTASLFHG